MMDKKKSGKAESAGQSIGRSSSFRRMVEDESRRLSDAMRWVRPGTEEWLEGTFGRRRRRAVLEYADRAMDLIGNLGLLDPEREFILHELLIGSTYNGLDEDCDLRLGAALWILDRLQIHGRLTELMDVLEDVKDPDEWFLPPDFIHPSYGDSLVRAMVSAMTARYGRRAMVTNGENERGKEPGETWRKILALLPEEETEDACRTFADKLWEVLERKMRSLAAFDKEMGPLIHQLDAPVAPLAMAAEDREGEMEERLEELESSRQSLKVGFERVLRMDRKAVMKMTGSREAAKAVSGFRVEDPFALCFALIALLDRGEDLPWLMGSGTILMDYVRRMLPWFEDKEDWDDEEWEDWYIGKTFNWNSWVDRGRVPDAPDYYHTLHGGRNLAQIIYDLSGGVVPTGIHPFEREREQLILEGMEEGMAGKITGMAEIFFLSAFQADQHGWSEDSFFSPLKAPEAGEEAGEPEAEAEESEAEMLRKELTAARRQIRSLKKALSETDREAARARAGYEKELADLRREHRELADLRGLVFNRDREIPEETGETGPDISYPYETRKRTVVFGGHDTFLKAIRPLLPDVRFVDRTNLNYSPEIVRNAEVVWIQTNSISHSQYGGLIRICRMQGIQVRYFAYASAEKCAAQLVLEDRKD